MRCGREVVCSRSRIPFDNDYDDNGDAVKFGLSERQKSNNAAVDIRLIGTARIVCGVRRSVRSSVPTRIYSSEHTAAGLLLWSRPAADIDRLLQQRRAAGECGQCHVVSVRK